MRRRLLLTALLLSCSLVPPVIASGPILCTSEVAYPPLVREWEELLRVKRELNVLLGSRSAPAGTPDQQAHAVRQAIRSGRRQSLGVLKQDISALQADITMLRLMLREHDR
jgi:hypothetical protein